MDKSFNDQELSDIMKEIEALEDEFKTEGDPSTTAILEDLANLEQEKAVPQTQAKVISFEQKPKAVTTSAPASGTSMSFKVNGDINLDLQFDIGGKIVSLAVSDKGLTIQMDGGMTFNVPLTETSAKKKSA